ncbi:MmyB family transcriptional regulator [Fodinicola feengrottensis]|uniref:MmyB family transcriptional regulator n=1 Tax=Fodinicola feengrottensis TaxID=435914 RepID=UPI0036F35551
MTPNGRICGPSRRQRWPQLTPTPSPSTPCDRGCCACWSVGPTCRPSSSPPTATYLPGTALAARVNPAWSPGHNLIEFTFLDPRAPEVYPDWEDITRQAVAGLRTTAAARRAELDPFVAAMRERSETFRELWDSHDVYERVIGDKRLLRRRHRRPAPQLRNLRARRTPGARAVRVLSPT